MGKEKIDIDIEKRKTNQESEYKITAGHMTLSRQKLECPDKSSLISHFVWSNVQQILPACNLNFSLLTDISFISIVNASTTSK